MDSKHSKCDPIVKWKQLGWLWCGAQGANQKIWSHPKHDWVGREDTKDKWQSEKHVSNDQWKPWHVRANI
jgi:hypothetical protein